MRVVGGGSAMCWMHKCAFSLLILSAMEIWASPCHAECPKVTDAVIKTVRLDWNCMSLFHNEIYNIVSV